MDVEVAEGQGSPCGGMSSASVSRLGSPHPCAPSNANASNAQMYKCTNTRIHNYTNAPVHKSKVLIWDLPTRVHHPTPMPQMHKCTNPPIQIQTQTQIQIQNISIGISPPVLPSNANASNAQMYKCIEEIISKCVKTSAIHCMCHVGIQPLAIPQMQRLREAPLKKLQGLFRHCPNSEMCSFLSVGPTAYTVKCRQVLAKKLRGN